MASTLTDHDIIKQVLAGEKDGYAELVRRHHAQVLAVCHHLLLNSTQAQDAAQDILVNAYNRLTTFRGDAAFSTWLYRIATNHCLDLLRKRKRERSESFDALIEQNHSGLAALFSSNPGPESTAEKRDLIHHLLSYLNENERAILVLRETQGFSYGEIAAVLDCSIDAVKARLKRARRSLQEKARHIFKLENV